MKNYKLKVYTKVVLMLIIFVINIVLASKSIAMNTSSTNEQKAMQEVAMAYYNKGIYGQYCHCRKSFLYSPEEATSQHTIYSVCSDFTYAVYYQTFGIQIPDITGKIIAYGEKYYDSNNITTNDVIEYWEKKTDDSENIIYVDNNGNQKDIKLSTEEGRAEYANILLTEYNLQIGDILCYHSGSSGHALLVYDILYDSNGNPIDALILESTSKYEKNTTKITEGLSYAELLNENTNVKEGTFQARYLVNTYTSSSSRKRDSFVYSLRNMSYCTILRPLLKDKIGNYTNQYYDSDFTRSSNTNIGYTCTGRTLKNYETKETTLNRIQYSLINIEKTVDVFNNSVVNLGDILEYSIKVTNNSKENYQSFDIIEHISELVDILDGADGIIENNTIKWNISNLEAGNSIEIKYRVKVKKDMESLGKKIISTGLVAGIPSSTIKNEISSNLNISEKNMIRNQTQNFINNRNYVGQELISKIYSDSLGLNLGLQNMNITDLIITRNGTQYYPEGSTLKPTVYLNQENAFSKAILSNYYGALNTDSSVISLKLWENSSSKVSGRSERADTIYEKNLTTGDILIYKNTQTAGDNVTYETEDGTYYLIYISEENKIIIDGNEFFGFIGVDESGEIKRITNDFTSLQTLLGKDYYTIFRPSMIFAKERVARQINKIEVTTMPIKTKYIQNYENLDLTGGILTVTYKDKSTDTISLTNEKVKITGFDNNTIGTNVVTVEYEGETTTFDITIIAQSDKVEQENNVGNGLNKNNSTTMKNKKIPTILPYTGIQNLIIIAIIGMIIINIMLYKKNKKYKDIK